MFPPSLIKFSPSKAHTLEKYAQQKTVLISRKCYFICRQYGSVSFGFLIRRGWCKFRGQPIQNVCQGAQVTRFLYIVIILSGDSPLSQGGRSFSGIPERNNERKSTTFYKLEECYDSLWQALFSKRGVIIKATRRPDLAGTVLSF